jgi:hypothetical protein
MHSWWWSFGFLHWVVFKYSNILEEHTASVLMVTELILVDSEVIWKKMCVGYIR